MQFFRFWEVKNISKIYPIILAFLVVFPSNFRLLSYFNGPWGLFLSLLMLNFTLFWGQKKFKGYYPWTFLSFERPRILPKFASWFWCFWGVFPLDFIIPKNLTHESREVSCTITTSWSVLLLSLIEFLGVIKLLHRNSNDRK